MEALQKSDQGGLARPGAADDRGGLACGGAEGDVAEHRPALAIGECDAVEADVAFRYGERRGAGRIALPWAHIEDLVDHPRIDQRALQIDLHAGEPARRVVGQQQRGDEGKHAARRLQGIGGAVAGIGDHAGDGEAGQHLGDRGDALGDACDLVLPGLGVVHQGGDLPRQLVLHGEGLDDCDALRGLLHGADQPRIDLHRLAGDLSQPSHQAVDGVDERRADQQGDQRQHRLLHDHHRHQRDQRDGIARHRLQRHAEQVADAVDVLVDARRQLAGARVVEEVDAQPHQMIEDAPLVAGDKVVADLGQHHGLAVAGEAPDDEGERDRAGDERDEVAAAAVEQLVDDVAHDPGAEGGGGGHREQADHGKHIVPQIGAAILRQDAAEHGDHVARGGSLAGDGHGCHVALVRRGRRMGEARLALLLEPFTLCWKPMDGEATDARHVSRTGQSGRGAGGRLRQVVRTQER